MTTIVWHGCGTEASGIDDGTDTDADADADTVRFDRNGRLQYRTAPGERLVLTIRGNPGLEIEDPPGFHFGNSGYYLINRGLRKRNPRINKTIGKPRKGSTSGIATV